MQRCITAWGRLFCHCAEGTVPWKNVLRDFWGPFQRNCEGLKDLKVSQVVDMLDEVRACVRSCVCMPSCVRANVCMSIYVCVDAFLFVRCRLHACGLECL